MWAVKVEKQTAETVRRVLRQRGLLDQTHLPQEDGEFVLLPVNSCAPEFNCVEAKLSAVPRKPATLEEILAGKLSEEKIKNISKRFDLVGTVAVLEIEGLTPAEEKIVAEGMKRLYPHLTAVVKKSGTIENEYRVRPVELILGDSTETVYTEYGVRMKLDVAKVYFSPRLATERLRVAQKVQPKERVLVMFAGVGPYALLIAKRQPLAKVVGVEINPEAVKYFEENVALNRLEGRVDVFGGDVREVVSKLGKFDRIVMPLPKDAGDFLDVAVAATKPNAIVHFYGFAPRENLFEEAEKKLRKFGMEILERKVCGNIGPYQFRIVIDARVKS